MFDISAQGERKGPMTSKVNPGWQGTGIPTARETTLGQVRPIAYLLRQGDVRFAGNRLAGSTANFANFYLWSAFRKKRVECPCCGWTGASFVATWNWRAVTYQAKCPQCDSRSRHRGLTCLLPGILQEKPTGDILVFAPELVLLNRLAQLSHNGKIVTADYYSIDVDFPGIDIQEMSFEEHAFALIVCNHVLEHVADDQQALYECARVLMPGGMAVFTIPGDFDHPSTWYFDKPDSNGHYRHYGMDVIDKMRRAFPKVEAIDMSTVAPRKYGVRKNDCAFICVK